MDPFTQRMLEKAEQRSRALGITNASKFPLAECIPLHSTEYTTNVDASSSSSSASKVISNAVTGSGSANSNSKVVILDKANLEASPTKPLRHYAAVNKENMEMGIEINITTDKPIGVQVEIQEQDVTDDEEQCQGGAEVHEPVVNQPLARLRDTSRNRLQRMGALYSNTNDLSSPIHRTEGQFHADDDDVDAYGHTHSPRKAKQRFGKLAALANTINQWEDDTAHHDAHRPLSTVPPQKPDLPSRHAIGSVEKKTKSQAPQPPRCVPANNDAVDDAMKVNKTKQLKWDPKVLSSLEAQGFQRRESSTIKHTYDYTEQDDAPSEAQAATPAVPTKSTAVSKVAKTFDTATMGPAKPDKPVNPAPTTTVKSGLVSGRAAIFENKAYNACQTQNVQRNQKDPCELSLKERMKLFETGNNKAMLPKAPISSAPTISQIRQDQPKVHPVTAAASSNLVKPKPENKLRDKVAALVANAQSSAENRIKDIDRQRQEDMQIIANRFNKQKELLNQEATFNPPQQQQPQLSAPMQGKVVRPMPPPPPPPVMTASVLASSKRRSPGDAMDEESKRARTSNSSNKAAETANRLYPALSDLDSSGDNCCATVTASLTDGTDQEDELESYMEESEVDSVAKHSAGDEDDEQSQTEDSSAGMCNVSLGREIMHVVQQNEAQQQSKKTVRYAEQDFYYGHDGHDSSMNSSSVASTGMDDYLDEALGDDDDGTQDESEDEHNASHISRGSKGTTASNSFSFRKTPAAVCQTIAEHEAMDVQTPLLNGAQPVKSELSVNQDNDNLVTLVHTVSFYRRQQSASSNNSTPVRKICREQQVLRSALDAGGAKHKLDYGSPQQSESVNTDNCIEEEDDGDEHDSHNLNDAAMAQDKIKKLLSEVCKQQQVIGQASQALNLCAATVEFSGSTESVEGERYLLLATHRRQACLDEVQRLRVENSLRPVGAPKEKGQLIVKEITIPLRQEYVRKMATGTITGHHLVCLLKYNEHVLATKTVPTMPGLLSVKFPDVLQLNNVYADFRITLEIYGMLAQRDQLPHELKYHINQNKKGGIKTPKKKGGENRLVMPPVQSPAGPHVVRTPQLVQYGFAIFSLREIQRTTWTLTQVLGVSPLEGVVHMKVNCELSVCVEYKGFLTMFEDISGFGAWHRRWCYLNGSVLNFWKYPDDEKKKTPMGSIDLNACTSQKVSTAPRDICARLNTMLLECERPAIDTDQESLIIVPNGRMTTVRHLLSADTKEEREEWCAYFNKALTLIRAWGPTH
ncbi:anillin isoform X2 [Scaptodrosophila lebanonensis]|uniref:Anillin isoform X2 n=1 Tax=Drosophila lebanonensis TaxID=7225 RepID=A0A6J2SY72_DROLE|nr:anillin isoform X2 [Scaptodrosophila lebanonensis]